jgi:RNA 2',3'-cyclic 3'-phosphodiesterase
MRLFFALWPPVAAAGLLDEWAGMVQQATGGRRTPEGNIHLTLAFLGKADAERAIRAAKRVRGKAHHLPIEQARYVRANRMVWVAPRETPAALSALHESLAMELYREEFILERRPFAAHVTLIRDAQRAELPALPEVAWPVSEFVLVRSSVSSRGSTYEPLERFTLQP